MTGLNNNKVVFPAPICTQRILISFCWNNIISQRFHFDDDLCFDVLLTIPYSEYSLESCPLFGQIYVGSILFMEPTVHADYIQEVNLLTIECDLLPCTQSI